VTDPVLAGETLLDREELASIAKRIGGEIALDYPDGVVLVALLKGSLCFVADLVREIAGPCEIDFLALSAYGDGGTRVKVAKDLDIDVTGRDVVVVMDLVDTGLTLGYVLRLLAERRARSASACALLDRRCRRLLPVEIRYVGRVVGEDYVVGYGLDRQERYRNLPSLETVDEEELGDEPHVVFDRLSQR
jgi:hypoxanthine phosphoribosyltransferase